MFKTIIPQEKRQIKELEKKVDKYAKTVGKLTVERNWAVGCSKAEFRNKVRTKQSLDLSTKREMVDVQVINNTKN